MKKLIIALPIIAALAACDTPEGTLAATGIAGAVAGAAVSSSSDEGKGAVIGAAAGLVAGTLINRQQGGNCVYERNDGSRYVASCP